MVTSAWNGSCYQIGSETAPFDPQQMAGHLMILGTISSRGASGSAGSAAENSAFV
jgi:hypothetical protein